MKPRLESCTASLLPPRGPFLRTAVTPRHGSHISCWVSLSLISVRCLSFELSQHLKPSSVRQCCHWNMPALYFKLFERKGYLFHLCTPVSGPCGEYSVNGPDAVWVLKSLTSEAFLLSEKTTSPHPYNYEVLVYLRIYQLEIILCKRDSVLIPDCSSLARWPWAELWNNFCRLWLESFKWRIWHRLSPCSNGAAKLCGLEAELSCWKTSGQWELLPECLYICAVPWRFLYIMCKAKQMLK